MGSVCRADGCVQYRGQASCCCKQCDKSLPFTCCAAVHPPHAKYIFVLLSSSCPRVQTDSTALLMTPQPPSSPPPLNIHARDHRNSSDGGHPHPSSPTASAPPHCMSTDGTFDRLSAPLSVEEARLAVTLGHSPSISRTRSIQEAHIHVGGNKISSEFVN